LFLTRGYAVDAAIAAEGTSFYW